jgi:hypothetical protein
MSMSPEPDLMQIDEVMQGSPRLEADFERNLRKSDYPGHLEIKVRPVLFVHVALPSCHRPVLLTTAILWSHPAMLLLSTRRLEVLRQASTGHHDRQAELRVVSATQSQVFAPNEQGW